MLLSASRNRQLEPATTSTLVSQSCDIIDPPKARQCKQKKENDFTTRWCLFGACRIKNRKEALCPCQCATHTKLMPG